MSTSDKVREFREERDAAVMEMANDERLKALSMDWMLQADNINTPIISPGWAAPL